MVIPILKTNQCNNYQQLTNSTVINKFKKIMGITVIAIYNNYSKILYYNNA